MKFDRLLIDNGERVPKNMPDTAWPYPHVNPKVIEKGSNEAGIYFLSMPDTEKYSEIMQTAANEGLVWGHTYAVPENSSTTAVTGMFNQMAPGENYPSGFRFSIETETPQNGLIPCIGFNEFFELTAENLGTDRYNGLVAVLKTGETAGNWAIPDADVLTGLGIRIYRMNGSVPEDITNGVSFGIDMTGAENGLLILSYGAVMADTDIEFRGKALNLSGEDELVWSDGNADGVICGEWWIGLDTDDFMADGDGTKVSPYEIETAEQLNRVRYGLDKHYVLTADINLSEYDNWQPIGSFVPYSESEADEENPDLKYAFTGTFDGRGFTISDLTIGRSDEPGVGLFGCVVGPVKTIGITGMKCENCPKHVSQDILEVEGVKFVQIDLVVDGVSTAKVILSQDTKDSAVLDEALTAAVEKRKTVESISELSVEGPSVRDLVVRDVNISGGGLTAGVVGYASYCNLENITLAEGSGGNTVTGGTLNHHGIPIDGSMTGGIVGGGMADLTGCRAEADITVGQDAGMAGILAGGMENSRLIDCSASGTVTAGYGGVSGIGGLAGCAFESTLVKNCSVSDVTVTVTGIDNRLIGGLLGMAGTTEGSPTEISDCAADNVEIAVSDTTSEIGGIVGGGYSVDEETIVVMLDAMALTEEEYAAYYDAYSLYFTPGAYRADNCRTNGTITGGLDFIGSVAGLCAENSSIENCVSDMTRGDGSSLPPSGKAAFAGGSGTIGDPYQISDAEQLNEVRYHLGGSYVLTSDIDLSGMTDWEPVGVYVPDPEDDEMPVFEKAFTGTFDGAGFTVSGINIDREETWGVGLFGCVAGTKETTIEITGMNCQNCVRFVREALLAVDGVQSVVITLNPGGVSTAVVVLAGDVDNEDLMYAVDHAHHYTAISATEQTARGPGGATVSNLTVKDINVSGSALVGGVVGYAYDCVFDHITLSGRNEVSGSAMVGGIAGGAFADFTDCDASADIILQKTTVGGETIYCQYGGVFAGGVEEGSFDNCTAKGTITSDCDNVFGIGGLAACAMESAFVSNCSADVTISVSGNDTSLIGGLLGFTGTTDEENPTVISDCCADADISVSESAQRVGGLVGGGFFAADYEEYYPVPTMYTIMGGKTAGSITGGSFAVGSIAGHAYRSEVTDCSSTMTWNSGDFDIVGEIQPETE